MNILGIDTSFSSDTVIGIYFSDSEQLSLNLKAPLSQEEKLLFTIDSVLRILKKEIQDIELFAVGIGPGSFTGIRIGIAAAQSLAWSQNKKLIGISSLELLALSIPEKLIFPDTLVVPMIDARMSRVFSAVFQNGKNLTGDLDITPEELLNHLETISCENIILLGDGLIKYGSYFQKISSKNVTFLNDISVSGLTICTKANSLLSAEPDRDFNPKKVLPVYLRKSEAEVQWDAKNPIIG